MVKSHGVMASLPSWRKFKADLHPHPNFLIQHFHKNPNNCIDSGSVLPYENFARPFILELVDVDLTLLYAQPLSRLLCLYYKERDDSLPSNSSWDVWILWRLEFWLTITATCFYTQINDMTKSVYNRSVQSCMPNNTSGM